MLTSIYIVLAVIFIALLLAVIVALITRRHRKDDPSQAMLTIDKKHTFLTSKNSKSGSQTMVVLDEKELFDQPPGF